MSLSAARAIVERSGAIRHGHFVLDSGLHATRFFQAVDALADVRAATVLIDSMAESWSAHRPAAVLGANEAGSVLAWSVALRLGAAALFARRSRNGYEQIGVRRLPDGPVLVVDDVTTTGGTARHLLGVVRRGGGSPIGVALLATKGLFEIDLGVRTTVLVTLEGMDAVPPQDCRACAAGEPFS